MEEVGLSRILLFCRPPSWQASSSRSRCWYLARSGSLTWQWIACKLTDSRFLCVATASSRSASPKLPSLTFSVLVLTCKCED